MFNRQKILQEEIDREIVELGLLEPNDPKFEKLSESIARLEEAKNKKLPPIGRETLVRVVGGVIVTAAIILFQKTDVLDRSAASQIPRII